jgi:hypothetical protein
MSAGDILHHKRFNQPLHFEGCSFGTITPTDFDAVFEFRDKVFVMVEVKHKNAPTPMGQRWAHERFCKAISHKPGATAVAFYCEHEVPPEDPIMLKDVLATEVYSNIGHNSFRWCRYQRPYPLLLSKVNDLLDKCGLNSVERCENVVLQ